MYEGRIIEYIEQGKFICALCLQERGGRLHVLTPLNRELNLTSKRAFLTSQSAIDPARPREEVLERLRRAEESRESLKAGVKVKELWELIHEESEYFDHRYLAQLVFGEKASDAQISAVVRALFEDRLHFRLKDDRFLPNDEAKVTQIARQMEEEALKAERLEQGSAWLREVRQAKPAGAAPNTAPSCGDDVIAILKNLALYGDEAPDVKFGKELLGRAGIGDIRESRSLLVKMGIWHPDENLDLLRLAIPDAFSEAQLEEAERLSGFTVLPAEREDLGGLEISTIDGPTTLDFDDAFSFERQGDLLRVAVHIADVGAMIPPDSLLDQEAALRGSSLYLPSKQIPMMPPRLSHETLSLKQGLERPAVSLLATFGRDGELQEHRFALSIIRVGRQLNYDQVNQAIQAGEGYLDLHQFCRQLRQKRLRQGALNLSLPELVFRLEDGGPPSLELVEQDTPSRMIIAELMILYNWLAAGFCRDRQIPILFRSQPQPGERLPLEENAYLYYVFQQRRKLSPLQIDLSPASHSGLGLEVYTQATSPIRRYLDLVVQRQIAAVLRGEAPFYSAERLEEIRLSVEPTVRELERVKRNRLRYLVLRYLGFHRERPQRATILHELRGRYRLVLNELLTIAEIRQPEGILLRPGQEITVGVRKADPWSDTLELEFQGTS